MKRKNTKKKKKKKKKKALGTIWRRTTQESKYPLQSHVWTTWFAES